MPEKIEVTIRAVPVHTSREEIHDHLFIESRVLDKGTAVGPFLTHFIEIKFCSSLERDFRVRTDGDEDFLTFDELLIALERAMKEKSSLRREAAHKKLHGENPKTE